MCGCECFKLAKSMHSSLLTWINCRLKHFKDIIHNTQKQRSGEISSPILETYNNSVRPHGCNIYNTASNMSIETMCYCTSKHHGLLHWKFLLYCCDKCPSIVLPGQEENKDTTETCPTIRFHVYPNVSNCNIHGRRPYQ